MKLFSETMPFLKGNLHCHTTRSDGKLRPKEVEAVYRAQGYDFLAITDHRILSPQARREGGMLLLPGVEMDYALPGEALHMIGFGMSDELADWLRNPGAPQDYIDAVRRYGGRAIIAHPAWSLNTLSTLTSLNGVTAVEIYNTVSGLPWNGDRADSSLLMDIAATHGKLFRFVASDDAHFYNGEAGRSYTMVQADELSQAALIAAMDAGRFYCSQGPRFEQITMENGRLEVRCSPVSSIVFYSNLVWSNERTHTGVEMTSASYDLTASNVESFVRVQLVDAAGRSAWSNPIALQ
ncbi:MAG: CehA/McbA family metallohydrolase [Clostridia bacterium]